MASVFLYHVVGDLTVGKPDLVEFYETETVEAAIRAIGESRECSIPVWRKRLSVNMIETTEMRQQRFVGIVNPLDIVAFLAKDVCLENQEKALKAPVSEAIVPDNSLLKCVDPGTRLIDALELMKQGVRHLLVPKSILWKGMSKRFSFLYSGKSFKNLEISNSPPRPSSSYTAVPIRDKFCCLSREDIIRFIIGCLGALAPLPLSSISYLGIINPNYSSIEASSPAIEVTRKLRVDHVATAVVEPAWGGQVKIIGEISASKLWKCDYLAATWALANLTAGQFVMGVEDSLSSRSPIDDSVKLGIKEGGLASRPRKLSSENMGFFSKPTSLSFGVSRSMYRGRSTPLTCKDSNSLAAVMAQMLSHRATHLWVTESENEDILVGVVGYEELLMAVTKQPATVSTHQMAPISDDFETE